MLLRDFTPLEGIIVHAFLSRKDIADILVKLASEPRSDSPKAPDGIFCFQFHYLLAQIREHWKKGDFIVCMTPGYIS